MRRTVFTAVLLAMAALTLFGTINLHPTAAAPPPAGTTLKQVATIDLPGPAGKRFDYLTIDYDDGYLLSAHLGAGLLYVIDLKTNKVVMTIPDVPGVEGVEYVPELKKIYTSDWHEKKIGVIDLRQGKVIAKLPAQQKPDGSAYAPPFHKLYVSDERAKTEIVVDVQTDKIVNTLNFKSETGMPQYDPVAKLIYVNLQELDTMTVIDPATDKVKTPVYEVHPCKGNHGMALDVEHRRAFLVCEDNNLMAVIDLEKHRVVTTLPSRMAVTLSNMIPVSNAFMWPVTAELFRFFRKTILITSASWKIFAYNTRCIALLWMSEPTAFTLPKKKRMANQ